MYDPRWAKYFYMFAMVMVGSSHKTSGSQFLLRKYKD